MKSDTPDQTKAQGVSGLTTFESWHVPTTLLAFSKDDQTGEFDIVDGKFDYRGELPITDAARMLFDTIALHCTDWWIERAAAKVSLSTPPKVGSEELDAAGLYVAVNALKRLASPEAFKTSRMANPEEIARMKYADEALADIAALAAPVDHPEVVGVKIKPLEWTDFGAGKRRANSAVGYYVVAESKAFRGKFYISFGDSSFLTTDPLDGFEATKAAAQADYETRIRSALQPSDSPALEAGVAVTVTEKMIERALYAGVPGGSKVWVWLPQADAWTPHQTARDVMRCALEAALSVPAKEDGK